MNIDGSARQGSSTGGGVLRDSGGNLIGGFSNFYGEGTNTGDEFRALRDGLQFCTDLGVVQVVVESDASIVVNAVRMGVVDNWRLEYLFRKCMQIFAPSFRIIHGYPRRTR